MSNINLQKVHMRHLSAPFLDTSVAISGQITVASAGTAVQGSDIDLLNGIYIKALSTNSGVVYVGNDGAGDVSNSNGYELSAGEDVIVQVQNLSQLWFDAAIGGDKLCWLKV